MKVKVLGAAKNVTGSKILVEKENARILIDCGLYQEREFRSRNWEDFPVNPSGIQSVLLTHAHLDHCGYLPKFLREGFRGKIYCTPPTAEIVRIVLMDSAKLQEEDAKFKRKRHKKEGRKSQYPELPLYKVEDARKVFSHFITTSYKKEVNVAPGMTAVFYDAGHILGSSMIELRVDDGGKEKILIFSGDIGRWGKPILCDPTIFQKADYVFIESTYGNRLHEEQKVSEKKFIKVIRETQKSGGNIIIPTFAIERAQELLYYLSEFLREDKIPHLMVFVDSPMAINVTEVFKEHFNYFDKGTKELIQKGTSPFDFPLLRLSRSVGESKAINYIRGTSIILAGSGMCTGGRVKHHLMKNITRPESTILFVGYQAKGTLGREILEKAKIVRILGRSYPVRAQVEKINGFSAHADKKELLKWISGFGDLPKKIFLVHGEEEVIADFATVLREKFRSDIVIPEYLQAFEI